MHLSRLKTGLIMLLFLIPLLVRAQADVSRTEQDSIRGLFQKMHAQETDPAKKSLNRDILDYFSKVLSKRESFSYSFEDLDMVGVLTAPDKSFRIFTWNIPMQGFTHEYHGLIQKPLKGKQDCRVYLLKNGIHLGNQMLQHTFSNDRWPGALYYEVHRNRQAGEVFYTLLGYHFNDRFSDKKVIEAMYFTDDGRVVFGKPVFRTEQGIQHRVLFEYSGETVLNLRYHPGIKMIVFDHLAPIEPELAGHPRFYAPDFSYDGFRFRRGFWEYRAEIDVRNR